MFETYRKVNEWAEELNLPVGGAVEEDDQISFDIAGHYVSVSPQGMIHLEDAEGEQISHIRTLKNLKTWMLAKAL